jgi:uncharacterized membrane protein HdeD (DUF308 family)
VPTIAAGIVSALAGVLVLAWPDITVVVLAWLFGIQLVVAGILQLVATIWGGEGAAARVLLGLGGALSILVGLLCLRGPLQTAALLGLLVGATWVVTGVISIIHAFTAAPDRSRGLGVASGLLSAIAGAVVIVYPGASIVVLTWLFGIVLVVAGLVVLVQGIIAARHTDRRHAPPAAARPGPAAPSPS